MAEEILGNYRLLKHMATGQTSQVWEVVENSSGRHFAMKLLLPEKAEQLEHRKFLMHEAEVGMKLAHPNIIRIVAIERNPKNPYFVMEFFPAGSLRFRMFKKETEFLREKGQDILKQVATALAFMNAKGWVHRDIKPDNILVNSSGDVRVIDFAIAQRIPTGWSKLFYRKVKAQGTRSYMSPEQIRGEALDGRADIYSFGIMAYELVTGRVPFKGVSSQDLLAKHITEKPASPQQFNQDVTKEFAELILQMLAKKRPDRPHDFHDVLIRMRQMRMYSSVEKAKEPE
jgi:serine/threonine protein kinase